MPATLRLLAVAAVLVAAGGATYLLIGSNREPAELATGEPSELATEKILGLSGSEATWSADRPAVFGHPAGTYEFDNYSASVARSPDGTTIPLGQIAADGTTAILGVTAQCSAEGTYRYRLSVDYLTLALEAVNDTCADRQSLVEGEWHRLASIAGIEEGHPYYIDMGVQVAFIVPEWPSASATGPFVATEGLPGRPPRSLRIGVHETDGSAVDYEFRIVVDPRLANDVCDAAKGWMKQGWTLDDVAARVPASEAVKFSSPTRMQVGPYHAVMIDVAGSEACNTTRLTVDHCCPDDMVSRGTAGRIWVVDMHIHDGICRRCSVLMSFLGNQHGVTKEQLASGSELVASLRIAEEFISSAGPGG